MNKSPICKIDPNNQFLYLYNPRLSLHKISLDPLQEVVNKEFSHYGREHEVELLLNNDFLLLVSSDRIELFDRDLNSIANYKDSIGIETEYMSGYLLKDYECDLFCNELIVNLEMFKLPYSKKSELYFRDVLSFKLPETKKK